MNIRNTSLRFQVLLTIVLVGVLVTTVIAIMLITQQRATYFNRYAVSLYVTSQEVEAQMLAIDESLRRDVLYLSLTPPISGIIRATQNDGIDLLDDSTLQSSIQRAQLSFTAFEIANPGYHKIRFIGAADGGRELIRVDKTDSRTVISSPEDLQRMGERSFFIETQALEVGNVYVSPINLNQENGAVELPQRPSWQAATPVFTEQGEFFGIVIISLDMGRIFADITERVLLLTAVDEIETYVTNSEGEFLLHPDPDHSFRFEFGESSKFEDEFSNLGVVVSSRDDDQPTSVDIDRNLLLVGRAGDTGDTLYLHSRVIDINAGDSTQTLTVWIALAQSLVDDPVLAATVVLWASTILIMAIILLLLNWILARQLAPLNTLAIAAQKIADGDYQINLPKASSWETNNLIDALSLLGEKVAQREAELRRNHNSLEEAIIELENSRDEAKRLVRVKGDFLANMSHEIRTPMTAVLGLLDILRHTQMNSQQQQYVFQIHNSSSALLHIINDILDISKIDADKLSIEAVDFSLMEVVEGSIDLFSPSAELKSVSLHLNMDPRTAIMVIGDRTRLSQVLNNLLGNAIKFTQEGSVTMATEIKEEQEQSITIRFSVADTGMGIKEDAMAKVFEAFEQADTTITRQFGGTGLGLVISHKLVALMGGELKASSVPDEGSTFWFDLTFERSDNKELSLEGVSIIDKRVLVVDDEPISCQILSSMLCHWGCEVDSANSGPQALEKITAAANEGEQYNFLLIDWRMPDIDGLSLLAEIRSLGESHQADDVAQVLMINEAERGEVEQSGKHTDDIRILVKPATISRLLNALAELDFIELIKEVPLEGVREDVETRLSAQLDAMASPAKLLLVEDNAINQIVIKELLGKYRLEIVIANNGAEAVEIVSREAIDLVLMDLQMPVMDGFEATRKIREFKPLESFPILALSAATFPEDIVQSSQAGMNEHLQKPIDVEGLLSALLKWLPLDNASKSQQLEPETSTASDIDSEESSVNAEEDVLATLKNDAEFDLTDTILSYAGAPALIRIIQAFCTEFNGIYEVWESDVEWDHAEKRRVVHSLKGAAVNVGAAALAELAARTESAIIGGEDSLLEELMQKLKEVLVKLEIY
jgi:signal transduction histidine kinase/DNA-binding response OmpR family regulator